MAQLKSTKVTGDLSASGSITTDSSLTGNNLKIEGGSFELYGTSSVPTAYIDFHYAGATGDYTSRIIESASGELSVNKVKMSDNVVYANHLVVPNTYSVKCTDTTGTPRVSLFLSSSDNLMIGYYASSGHSGSTYVNSYNGHVYLRNKNRTLTWLAYDDSTTYDAILRPSADSKALFGSSDYRWYRLYAASSTVQTSDEREKSDIMAIADYPTMYSRNGQGNVFEQLFDKLEPKTYTLNVENNSEMHIGFVAQDIEKSMEELGLSVDDLGLIIHDHWTDEETGEEKDRYGLAYEEFTALNTYMIQKQKERITTLENQIADREERIARLEALVKA